MKYKIDKLVFDTPQSVAEFCYSAGCFGTDDFDKELDRIYKPIMLGGRMYDYSFVFKRTNEVAYMREYKDWANDNLDWERGAAISWIETMEEAGDEEDINGYIVVAAEDEEE